MLCVAADNYGISTDTTTTCEYSGDVSQRYAGTQDGQYVSYKIRGNCNVFLLFFSVVVPPSSCKQLGRAESGQYMLNLGDNGGEFSVYCDMNEGMLGGGWTIIQRRVPEETDSFCKDWKSYKNGFGTFHGSFWLGLEKIHRITSTENYALYIAMGASFNRLSWAYYSSFHVGDEASYYELTISGYEGAAGDALSRVNGRSFSTFDQNSEKDSSPACNDKALVGGWWFFGCDTSNLNGRYYNKTTYNEDCIKWETRFLIGTPIHRVVMAIRPNPL